MNRISHLIKEERRRQQETLMLIPSENYTYPEVFEAVGSPLMHKYAEGLPGKRYYQGNQVVDEVERYCQEQALKTFDLKPEVWGVNVQPHSGSEANLAVISGLVEPGEQILSLYLPEGGHLSHGWHLPGKNLTLTSKIWQVEFYHLDPKTGLIDYEALAEAAQKLRPKLIISGGTAYPREIDHQKIGKIAKAVGAYYLADIAHEAGLVAGGANTSSFPFADVVTMTTHKTLRGPRGGLIFGRQELMARLNSAVFPGLQGGPHLHTIAGIAVALEKAQTQEFANYARQTVANAQVLAKTLADLGFSVASGGTDKHLLLLDLRSQNTNGWFAATALEAAGIIVNRNTVPGDTASPFYPSGIRLGTPAVTVRGMKEKEMELIAEWLGQIVESVKGISLPETASERAKHLAEFESSLSEAKLIKKIATEVLLLCRRFPLK